VIIIIDVADNDHSKEYEIRFLNETHLDPILCLQDTVIRSLSDSAIYYGEPIEFFRKQLMIKDGSMGIFKKEQVVGFHMASFPSFDEAQLGVDIGLNQEELSQFVQLGPVVIHPDHRKKGLLTRVANMHLKTLEEMGYKHVCLTISPNNYPTIRTTLAQGFVIKQIKKKFNNLLRYIFHLDFRNRFKQPKYSVRIPNTDIESQKFIFSLGFYGYSVLKNDNGFDIVFGHDEIKT